MDIDLNDAPGLHVRAIPTMKFFPRGEDKKIIEYDGGPEFEHFSTWLSQKSEAFKEARPEEVK